MWLWWPIHPSWSCGQFPSFDEEKGGRHWYNHRYPVIMMTKFKSNVDPLQARASKVSNIQNNILGHPKIIKNWLVSSSTLLWWAVLARSKGEGGKQRSHLRSEIAQAPTTKTQSTMSAPSHIPIKIHKRRKERRGQEVDKRK